MAAEISQIVTMAQLGFAEQERQLAERRSIQSRAVVSKTATGTGDIGHLFALDRTFRLVFVRCHFAGSAGTAPLIVSIDSSNGSAFDARLFTITQAGTSKDVHFRLGADTSGEPSAWTFGANDAVRIDWANPETGNITWGLEVGLAVASEA